MFQLDVKYIERKEKAITPYQWDIQTKYEDFFPLDIITYIYMMQKHKLAVTISFKINKFLWYYEEKEFTNSPFF